MTVPDCGTWRKMRDSNPRYPEEGIPDFESSAFGHSANLPFILSDAKVIHFSHLTKYCCYFLTILTPLYRILYYIEVSQVSPTRPERAETPSPGHRPGCLWAQTCRPVRAKAFKYLAIYKAFALTGRLADCHYTQGDALG